MCPRPRPVTENGHTGEAHSGRRVRRRVYVAARCVSMGTNGKTWPQCPKEVHVTWLVVWDGGEAVPLTGADSTASEHARHPDSFDGRREWTLLVVEAGGHRFGLPTSTIVELHRMVACVPVPEAPDVVDGIIDVRGTVVAVLDVRTRFGLARRPPLPSDHLVLVQVGARTLALRVDRVLDLLTVSDHTIDSAEAFPPEARLRGVARGEDGLLLILDVAALLSGDEVASLDAELATMVSQE